MVTLWRCIYEWPFNSFLNEWDVESKYGIFFNCICGLGKFGINIHFSILYFVFWFFIQRCWYRRPVEIVGTHEIRKRRTWSYWSHCFWYLTFITSICLSFFLSLFWSRVPLLWFIFKKLQWNFYGRLLLLLTGWERRFFQRDTISIWTTCTFYILEALFFISLR